MAEGKEPMQEMRTACMVRELITVCPCLCYMITKKGEELAKSLNEQGLEKDIEHVLDTQLGYNIFREPDWSIEQDNFIISFSRALSEKTEKEVKDRIYNIITLISDKELMTSGASAFFVFTYALHMAREFGYVRYEGEHRLELRDPQRFFKKEKNLAEVVK